jgi:hypothetical protein
MLCQFDEYVEKSWKEVNGTWKFHIDLQVQKWHEAGAVSRS